MGAQLVLCPPDITSIQHRVRCNDCIHCSSVSSPGRQLRPQQPSQALQLPCKAAGPCAGALPSQALHYTPVFRSHAGMWFCLWAEEICKWFEGSEFRGGLEKHPPGCNARGGAVWVDRLSLGISGISSPDWRQESSKKEKKYGKIHPDTSKLWN